MATTAATAPLAAPPKRGLLGSGVLLLCGLALAPVLALVVFALGGTSGAAGLQLGSDGPRQLLNTVALVLLVGGLAALLGTASGWLTARCSFPGRRGLRIAQLLPLATPSYLLAATLIDLGSRLGLRVHGLAPTTAVLVGAERSLRRRSRCWNLGNDGDTDQRWPLTGSRRWAAQLLCLLPPLLSLGLPLLWAALSWDQLQGEAVLELLQLSGRSFGLALLAALITVAAGVVLAIARRWIASPLLQRLTFIAGLGYAIPGTVLALALMLLGGPLALAPLLLLVWGYGDRFLAVAKGGLDAALERIPPSVDEAATSLGQSWPGVLRRVHLPLLRGPLLVGALLVFVDTVKELPLTFALRPFDFDTLAVRVYQYASDERVGAALVPALLILGLGLLAASALIPSLERLERR